jgi:hypothetical protein
MPEKYTDWRPEDYKPVNDPEGLFEAGYSAAISSLLKPEVIDEAFTAHRREWVETPGYKDTYALYCSTHPLSQLLIKWLEERRSTEQGNKYTITQGEIIENAAYARGFRDALVMCEEKVIPQRIATALIEAKRHVLFKEVPHAKQ